MLPGEQRKVLLMDKRFHKTIWQFWVLPEIHAPHFKPVPHVSGYFSGCPCSACFACSREGFKQKRKGQRSSQVVTQVQQAPVSQKHFCCPVPIPESEEPAACSVTPPVSMAITPNAGVDTCTLGTGGWNLRQACASDKLNRLKGDKKHTADWELPSTKRVIHLFW